MLMARSAGCMFDGLLARCRGANEIAPPRPEGSGLWQRMRETHRSPRRIPARLRAQQSKGPETLCAPTTSTRRCWRGRAMKVGHFLLRMAERLAGGPADRVVLPMSREDIADYLALSVETVSRALTQLKRRGVILLIGTRQVRISIATRSMTQTKTDLSLTHGERP